MNWTLAEVAVATGGVVTGDPALTITGVGSDSRDVAPGSLFVAVRGERFDGHEFAAAALGSGAGAVLVERAGSDVVPRIEVASTLTALRDLAARRRLELRIPVVGITGSSGKTSTKDLLAAAVDGSWASPRSFNNEIGVPLTVLGTPEEATALFVEVGSRGIGHIEWLAPAIRPDVAVITNVGLVHLETFGTPDRIVAAKWELVEALDHGGTAVLPVDDPRLAGDVPGDRITFGESERADVGVEEVVVDDLGRATFTLRHSAGALRISLGVAGRHQVGNAAAALAAGIALGRDPEELASGLERAVLSPWRMEVHRGRFTVVNDAYNANPDSMTAALHTVAAMPGRHVAVLGLMAELGLAEANEHRRIGRMARDLGYVGVVVVGNDPGYTAGAGDIAIAVPGTEAARGAVRAMVGAGDVVLVKASRAVGLEALAHELIEEAKA